MKNIRIMAKTAVFAASLAIAISPVLANPVLAKNDKKAATESATSTSFITKFKNFFLPPGIAKKANKGDLLPPGIAKKIGTTTNATTTPNKPNNPGTSTPDTTAPVMTNISVFNATSNAADIYWLTNEKASGKLYIATSSPVLSKAFSSLNFAGKEYFHHLQVTGLQATTTYMFVVVSTDEAGNTSTSSEQTFITKEASDTVVPVVSNLIATSTSSTTAKIGWVTNEPADGMVYWSTTTPVTMNASSTLATSTLSLVREFTIGGLNASTTYYFTVSSKDAAGNKAVVVDGKFVTLLE